MSTDENERKAVEYMTAADQKMGPSVRLVTNLLRTLTPRAFRGSSNSDDACELYLKAGNCFKMAKKWSEAGVAFSRGAAIYIQNDNRYEAASQFVTAATCFRKTDIAEALSCYMKANDIYADLGHISLAANNQIAMAELFEHEAVNAEMAMFHYQKAADFYEAENATNSMNKCLLKVASYAALTGQYIKGAEIFEQVATSTIDNANQRHSAKENFLRAGLCRLCHDVPDSVNAVEKYESSFGVFIESRECLFLKTLIAACEEQNLDKFKEAVQDYGARQRLDLWFTKMFELIEKNIDGDETLR